MKIKPQQVIIFNLTPRKKTQQDSNQESNLSKVELKVEPVKEKQTAINQVMIIILQPFVSQQSHKVLPFNS